VNHPSAILSAVDTLVVWGTVASVGSRPKASPWNAAERAGVAVSAIELEDESVPLRIEAESWRRLALAARRRLISSCRRVGGQPTADHPVVHAEQLGALGHPVHLAILRFVVQAGADGAAAERPRATFNRSSISPPRR
jgi:hypothetical protein